MPVSVTLVLAAIGLLGGLLVFSVAPYWPSLFPPAFARFVGFGSMAASLAPLWALTESWLWPAIVGGAALAAMAVVTLYQMRHPVKASEDAEEQAGEDASAIGNAPSTTDH